MLIHQPIRVRTQPICTPMSTIQIQNLYLVSFHFFHFFFLFAFFFSSQSSASVHQHVCTQRIRTLTPSDHLQGRCLFCLFFILIFVHQLCICNASAHTHNTSTSPIYVHMLCPPPFPSVSSFFFVFVYTNLCLHATHLMHTQGHSHARYLRLHTQILLKYVFFSFFFLFLYPHWCPHAMHLHATSAIRPVCMFFLVLFFILICVGMHPHTPSLYWCMHGSTHPCK